MGTTSEERLYKRRLNEFDQELKRMQRELAKLKMLKREGGRARKQLLRSMQREMELQSVLDDTEAMKFRELHLVEDEKPAICCNKCESTSVNVVPAGLRRIIVCMDCSARSTVLNEDAIVKTA